jgi:hypothetical protein
MVLVGQNRRVLGRQKIPASRRLVIDVTSRRHRAQPLAKIARVQAGFVRKLLDGNRAVRRRHRLEDSQLVADIAERALDGGSDVGEDLPGEGFYLFAIRFGCASHRSPSIDSAPRPKTLRTIKTIARGQTQRSRTVNSRAARWGRCRSIPYLELRDLEPRPIRRARESPSESLRRSAAPPIEAVRRPRPSERRLRRVA